MLRRVMPSIVMLAVLASMPICPAFQLYLDENPAASRLISTLPDRIDPPKPLFVDEEPQLREYIAFRLINKETHPLSALLTRLDAEAHGATLTFYLVDHLGPVGLQKVSSVLFEWIRSGDEPRRSKAWQFLYACRQLPPKTIPALTEFLVDENATNRSYACRLLGNMGDAARVTISQIEKLTTDDVAEIRGHAIEALGILNSVDSLPVVRKGMSDANARVQLAAVIATFQLTQGDEVDTRLLRKLHSDGTPETRKTILKNLHKLKEHALIFADNWKDQVRDASELMSLSKRLESLGPLSVDLLKELLADTESEDTRRSALVLLQWTKHEKISARPAVMNILAGDSRRLQLEALETLTTMGEIPFDDVANFLETSPGCSIAAAKCLTHCSPEDQKQAIEALRTLKSSDNVEVQLAACQSLLTLGIDQKPALKCLTLLLHPSQEIGADALERVIKLLEEAGPSAEMAIPLLIKSFTYEQLAHFRDERHPSAKALIAIGKPAIPRLLPALKHDMDTVQTKAAICLKLIDNEQSAHPLAERVWDLALHPEIYGMRFGQPAPQEVLDKLKEDTSSLPIRLTKLLPLNYHGTKALEALGRLGTKAEEALPNLMAHYETSTRTLTEHHGNPPTRISNIARINCERTAIAIYRIDPSKREPILTELNRAFTTYARKRSAPLISADLTDIAAELEFRNEAAFEHLQARVENDVFISPIKRAAAAYVLARVDPENPKWPKRLEEIADQTSARPGRSSNSTYCRDLVTRLKENTAE